VSTKLDLSNTAELDSGIYQTLPGAPFPQAQPILTPPQGPLRAWFFWVLGGRGEELAQGSNSKQLMPNLDELYIIFTLKTHDAAVGV